MNTLNKIVIAIFFLSYLSCTNELPLDIASTENPQEIDKLKSSKKLVPVTDINFVDDRFEAFVIYDNITNIGDFASFSSSKLLVTHKWGDPGPCVLLIKPGDTFDLSDLFTPIGPPFVTPGDILIYSDGTVFIADGWARTVFKISKHGGTPEAFVTQSTTNSEGFNPFGLAIAPADFDGPNVDPGDIIVADNGFGTNAKAVWAVNPNTGVARIIAQGSVFIDGPLRVEFNSDGTLFVSQNFDSGTGRIVTLSAEGTVTTFLEPIYARGALAIHPITDEIFFLGVFDPEVDRAEIHRIPKTGGTPELFASFQGDLPDMEFNKKGTALYVGYLSKKQAIQITAKKEIWEEN